MLIAFSGVKFSGKDTAAEALIKSYKFKRVALADKLKDICSSSFHIPREDMDNPDLKELPFETPIVIKPEHIETLLGLLQVNGFDFNFEQTQAAILKEFLGRQLKSIREVLQIVGTDICRTHIKDDIWLDYISKSINPFENLVITDARFKNERDYLKSLGATLILIKRGTVDQPSSHISENQLGEDKDYDVIVYNESCINHLQSSICMWYRLKHL